LHQEEVEELTAVYEMQLTIYPIKLK